ncbi:hypothetical protein ACWD0J_05340 [Streptomyces sp. NPDC003011]
MTLHAALSGAALRVMRRAAGRRALHVALLAGGLFALGLLCGEQAHAADGVPSVTASGSVRPVTKGAVAEVVPAPAEATTAKQVTPEPGGRPVGDLADSVAAGAESVSAGLAEVGAKRPSPPRTAPGAPSLPEPPDLPDVPGAPGIPGPPEFPTVPAEPSVPSAPSVPGLPGLPGLPAPPSLPGHTLPAPDPVPAAPQQDSVPASTPTPTPPSALNGRTPEGRSATTTSLAYGPGLAARTTTTPVAAHRPAHRADRPGYVPVRQAPTQSPGGALSGKSAMDNGTSRHGGDAHAVTFDHRAPLRLVPGAAAGVEAHGTRDRHRDIPVSPA